MDDQKNIRPYFRRNMTRADDCRILQLKRRRFKIGKGVKTPILCPSVAFNP